MKCGICGRETDQDKSVDIYTARISDAYQYGTETTIWYKDFNTHIYYICERCEMIWDICPSIILILGFILLIIIGLLGSAFAFFDAFVRLFGAFFLFLIVPFSLIYMHFFNLERKFKKKAVCERTGGILKNKEITAFSFKEYSRLKGRYEV